MELVMAWHRKIELVHNNAAIAYLYIQFAKWMPMFFMNIEYLICKLDEFFSLHQKHGTNFQVLWWLIAYLCQCYEYSGKADG